MITFGTCHRFSRWLMKTETCNSLGSQPCWASATFEVAYLGTVWTVWVKIEEAPNQRCWSFWVLSMLCQGYPIFDLYKMRFSIRSLLVELLEGTTSNCCGSAMVIEFVGWLGLQIKLERSDQRARIVGSAQTGPKFFQAKQTFHIKMPLQLNSRSRSLEKGWF